MNDADSKHRQGRARAVVGAVEVVVAAARGSFVAAVSLFTVSSLGMVALLFIGNRLLQELISSGSNGSDGSFTGRVWGLVVAALAIGGVVSFAGSAAAGMHRLLVERVIRYYGEITLRVAASVPLSEFDSPEFHDRMQRAKANQMAPMQLALAVPSLIGAGIGVVGVAIGLATVSPWLVGVTLIACVPLWFVGRNNSESMYSFSFGNTPTTACASTSSASSTTVDPRPRSARSRWPISCSAAGHVFTTIAFARSGRSCRASSPGRRSAAWSAPS